MTSNKHCCDGVKFYFWIRFNSRLNITPSSATQSQSISSRTTPSRHTPLRGAKRKRTLLEESEERSSSDYSVISTAKGDVEITEADPQGRFVKLTNKGNKVGKCRIRNFGDFLAPVQFRAKAAIDS